MVQEVILCHSKPQPSEPFWLRWLRQCIFFTIGERSERDVGADAEKEIQEVKRKEDYESTHCEYHSCSSLWTIMPNDLFEEIPRSLTPGCIFYFLCVA